MRRGSVKCGKSRSLVRKQASTQQRIERVSDIQQLHILILLAFHVNRHDQRVAIMPVCVMGLQYLYKNVTCQVASTTAFSFEAFNWALVRPYVSPQKPA